MRHEDLPAAMMFRSRSARKLYRAFAAGRRLAACSQVKAVILSATLLGGCSKSLKEICKDPGDLIITIPYSRVHRSECSYEALYFQIPAALIIFYIWWRSLDNDRL